MPRRRRPKDPVERAVWTGTLSFGLVNVPVALFPANRPKRVSLHIVAPDGTRLERRYFSESSDRQLDDSDLVHGYEVKKGKGKKTKMVVLDDDELERIAPDRTRDIGLQTFAPVDQVDPMYFDRAYYLAPTGPSTQAYRLLARVMEDEGRVGIAKVVMRAREHLVAVVAERGILRLETLHFADELRTPKDVGLPRPSRPSSASLRKMAQQIKRHSRKRFERDDLVDESALRLVRLAEQKRKAHEDVVKAPPPAPEESPDADVIDLMSRLQQSIKSGSKRHRKRKRAA